MRFPWSKKQAQPQETGPTTQDIFAAEWKTGDRDAARQMATQYVAENPERFAALEGLDVDALVGMVSAARASGDEQQRISIDMYLLARYLPRRITGTINGGT